MSFVEKDFKEHEQVVVHTECHQFEGSVNAPKPGSTCLTLSIKGAMVGARVQISYDKIVAVTRLNPAPKDN